MRSNYIEGRIGEISAKNYMKSLGYQIIKSNYRSPYGEIDIIAEKSKTCVFIEVKYRKNNKFGFPREAVGYKKQERIRNTALYYISENNITGMDFRFDVIEITNNYKDIVHIENAF